MTLTDHFNLKKLGRRDLLELLLKQSKRIDELEAELEETSRQLEEANQKLEDRTIAIRNTGSLAEAALALSGVFEAAQKACDLYQENVFRPHREEGDAYAGKQP